MATLLWDRITKMGSFGAVVSMMHAMAPFSRMDLMHTSQPQPSRILLGASVLLPAQMLKFSVPPNNALKTRVMHRIAFQRLALRY